MPRNYIKIGDSGNMEEEQAPNVGGANSANSVVATGADGRLDESLLPAGVGRETFRATASEAISAGDLVNTHVVNNALRIRKADASLEDGKAVGFVLANVANAAEGTVYITGSNTAAANMVPGRTYYLSQVAGKVIANAPAGAGEIVQEVGVAVTATELAFQPTNTIKRA